MGRLKIPSTQKFQFTAGGTMPRVSTRPTILLALSPNATATALGIRPEEAQRAIRDGLLPVYRMGVKSKILTADIETWVRSWPKPMKRGPYKKRIVPCPTK
jgi:hypothetical protein